MVIEKICTYRKLRGMQPLNVLGSSASISGSKTNDMQISRMASATETTTASCEFEICEPEYRYVSLL